MHSQYLLADDCGIIGLESKNNCSPENRRKASLLDEIEWIISITEKLHKKPIQIDP
jgi:hypothetical protein